MGSISLAYLRSSLIALVAIFVVCIFFHFDQNWLFVKLTELAGLPLAGAVFTAPFLAISLVSYEQISGDTIMFLSFFVAVVIASAIATLVSASGMKNFSLECVAVILILAGMYVSFNFFVIPDMFDGSSLLVSGHNINFIKGADGE